MVFYNDSFVKAGFFAKIMSKWDAPVFYFDFDLLYSGYVTAEEIPLPKNLTILSPDSDNLFENIYHSYNVNIFANIDIGQTFEIYGNIIRNIDSGGGTKIFMSGAGNIHNNIIYNISGGSNPNDVGVFINCEAERF